MNLLYDIIARLFGWDEIKVLVKEMDGKKMGFILRPREDHPPLEDGTIVYEIDPTKDPFPI